MGSGFVWDEEGHVITNYHVINDSANVKVSTRRPHLARLAVSRKVRNLWYSTSKWSLLFFAFIIVHACDMNNRRTSIQVTLGTDELLATVVGADPDKVSICVKLSHCMLVG